MNRARAIRIAGPPLSGGAGPSATIPLRERRWEARAAGPTAADTATPRKETAPMTAQTLPDEPNFCFVPAYDVETEVQQIRIVIEGLAGHVPTALIALHLDDALSICDKLNRRLGLDRNAWTAMAAASMRAGDEDPDGNGWH